MADSDDENALDLSNGRHSAAYEMFATLMDKRLGEGARRLEGGKGFEGAAAAVAEGAREHRQGMEDRSKEVRGKAIQTQYTRVHGIFKYSVS